MKKSWRKVSCRISEKLGVSKKAVGLHGLGAPMLEQAFVQCLKVATSKAYLANQMTMSIVNYLFKACQAAVLPVVSRIAFVLSFNERDFLRY